jgi:tRNA (guanosine-2'-O-)-methyltransferase
MMTETRRNRMLAASRERTRFLRLVIQDIHNPHNVAACMRSAEAFGIQDLDVVTVKASKWRSSNAARGVANWLTVRKHPSIEHCAKALKDAGYVLAAGVPKPGATPLHELPLDRPIAVIFGNEHDGIDLGWHQHIDLPFTIPMVGMVESLNISVCAAITLHHLTLSAKTQLTPAQYYLPEESRQSLLNDWACRHVAGWEGALERLRNVKQNTV